jgi:hypothetical protein
MVASWKDYLMHDKHMREWPSIDTVVIFVSLIVIVVGVWITFD